jgi:alanine dehydrogenase
MIDAIVNSVDGWKHDDLLTWVKEQMRKEYKSTKDSQVQYDYRILSELQSEQLARLQYFSFLARIQSVDEE